MADFVAYYRVSTDRQGVSGLGLDAQRASVGRFLPPGQTLVAVFTEIESRRRDTNRPQLHAALAECRKRQATLLIARLDRLARSTRDLLNTLAAIADRKAGFRSLGDTRQPGDDFEAGHMSGAPMLWGSHGH
jgi:DNA invertase Pin-like site-specific DNA recombinase